MTHGNFLGSGRVHHGGKGACWERQRNNKEFTCDAQHMRNKLLALHEKNEMLEMELTRHQDLHQENREEDEKGWLMDQ